MTEPCGDRGDRNARVDQQRRVCMAQAVNGNIGQAAALDKLMKPPCDRVGVNRLAEIGGKQLVVLLPPIAYPELVFRLP